MIIGMAMAPRSTHAAIRSCCFRQSMYAAHGTPMSSHTCARNADTNTGSASGDVWMNENPIICGPCRTVRMVASQLKRRAISQVPGTTHQPHARSATG